jgi:D-3-phosphoglycerate dehydrogenase
MHSATFRQRGLVACGRNSGSVRARVLRSNPLDVFPHEPASRDEAFESELKGLDNVILTPHVGGSTEEAQAAIAEDVA